MDSSKKAKLIYQAKFIFVGIPVGNNAPGDTPIRGNQSLAQVVVNRVDSVAKTREEFKYMIDVISTMLRETEGKTIRKIKFNPSAPLIRGGITDQNGFLLQKDKYELIKRTKS